MGALGLAWMQEGVAARFPRDGPGQPGGTGDHARLPAGQRTGAVQRHRARPVADLVRAWSPSHAPAGGAVAERAADRAAWRAGAGRVAVQFPACGGRGRAVGNRTAGARAAGSGSGQGRGEDRRRGRIRSLATGQPAAAQHLVTALAFSSWAPSSACRRCCWWRRRRPVRSSATVAASLGFAGGAIAALAVPWIHARRKHLSERRRGLSRFRHTCTHYDLIPPSPFSFRRLRPSAPGRHRPGAGSAFQQLFPPRSAPTSACG